MNAVMVQHMQANKCNISYQAKDKNHIVTSIDTEKTFDSVNTHSLLKSYRILIDCFYLNLIKAMCDKRAANIMLHEEKTESFHSKVRNKTRLYTVFTSTQYSSGTTSQSN